MNDLIDFLKWMQDVNKQSEKKFFIYQIILCNNGLINYAPIEHKSLSTPLYFFSEKNAQLAIKLYQSTLISFFSQNYTLSTTNIITKSVKLEPLTINKAWQGKRYKTKEYKIWEKKFNLLADKKHEKFKVLKNGRYLITIDLFMSTRASDIDNPIKPILDRITDIYNLDDKQYYELKVLKHIVPKNKEGFKYRIDLINKK